jgi:exopolyphosphatase/guanosine-5'-triphosphate,3'-diphosphate pyrophosphatase
MDYYQKNNQELEDPNGYNLKTKEINALVNNMKSLRSPEKIKKYWDLDTNRSEIILAGASILNILTNILGIKQWTVSNYALREGLVIDTYKRLFSGNSHNIESNIRWKSVLRLGNKLEIDSSQAESVLFFAEKIYDFIVKQKLYQDTSDQLSSLSNKELLQAAAWLHECGKFISFPRYHKHSIYLITNYRMLGFSQKERLLMGLVARYHRKGKAAKKNSYCESLSSKEIYLINLLASIIRIASAANRTRKKLIKDMHLEFSKKMITFRLVPNNKESLPSLDLEKMQTEKGGLEKIIGYPITIELL